MEENNDLVIVHPDLLVHFIKNYFLVILFFIIVIIAGVLVLLGYVESTYNFQILILFIITLIFLVISFFYSNIFCKKTSVTLESNQLVYQTGVFSSQRKIMSLDSILDTSLERSLLDKMFNVANLIVSTAGNEIVKEGISNIKYEFATQLHEKIHEKIRIREKKHRDRDKV